MPGQVQLEYRKSLVREVFEVLILALIVTLFLRTFVLQAFQIPSVSMQPTLRVGDRLFVDRLAYSPSLGGLEDALLSKRAVQRGDIVVFRSPSDDSRHFVKRVIGLPGETVEVRGRHVLLNGRELDEPYVHFDAPELPPDHPDYGLRWERALEVWGPQRVPENRLFVLGDNREQSNDSRLWGFLAQDRLRGRALLIYWSAAEEGLAGRDAIPERARGERLFRPLR